MWGYHGYGFGGGIGMLLFWGLIVVGVVWLLRILASGPHAGGGEARAHNKTPLEILGERYAKGEIDKAEFEQKRNDLKGI